NEKSFPSELTLLLTLPRSDSLRVKQELAKVLAQAVETDTKLLSSAETNVGLAEKLPPRFYIRITDENQMSLAQKVATALKERGWVVPGIQNVGSNSSYWDNELIYYRKSEPNAPPVEDIMTVLEKTTSSKWQMRYVPNYENSPNIRPGHFELQFATPTGKLLISLVDEEDNPLKAVKYTLHFEPQGGIGVAFNRARSTPGYIDVPPGSYDVRVTAKGYKELLKSLTIED